MCQIGVPNAQARSLRAKNRQPAAGAHSGSYHGRRVSRHFSSRGEAKHAIGPRKLGGKWHRQRPLLRGQDECPRVAIRRMGRLGRPGSRGRVAYNSG